MGNKSKTKKDVNNKAKDDSKPHYRKRDELSEEELETLRIETEELTEKDEFDSMAMEFAQKLLDAWNQ